MTDSQNENFESPWNKKAPSFQELPEVHPKTGEKIKLYVCAVCASIVTSRSIHTEWHKSLNK